MDKERDIAIQIEGLKKNYRLGVIGGGTLVGDIQSWWARKRGKDDPNLKIGNKTYGKNESFMALDGIDLTVYKGERLGIIGHNGAGKSTLLKLLSRVTGPTEGIIRLDGRISSMLEVGTGFSPELTGRENIYLNGAILGMSKAEVDSKIDKIIEFSEVEKFIDTPVKRYSSGMYVKLAFSVAAHLDSEILIMDEVLAVGDMQFQQKCLKKMSEVSREEGRTILYVSHNMNTIYQLCERCVVMDHGKIIFDGDVDPAVNIYMGNENNTDFPVKYDFTKKPRDYQFGKEVFINSFEFPEKQGAIFKTGEKLKMKVDFKSSIAVNNAHIVLTVMNEFRKKSFFTLLTEPFEIKKDCEQSISFELENDLLVEDTYSINFEIIARDSVGNYCSYDNPMATIYFKLVNDDPHSIIWETRYWGNVKLPEMKILDNSVE